MDSQASRLRERAAEARRVFQGPEWRLFHSRLAEQLAQTANSAVWVADQNPQAALILLGECRALLRILDEGYAEEALMALGVRDRTGSPVAGAHEFLDNSEPTVSSGGMRYDSEGRRANGQAPGGAARASFYETDEE